MVKEDHKRGSTNHLHRKAFSVISNKFKISLRIHQTYTKEKCFLQHGFSENGGVQTFDSLKQFE